MSHLLFLPFFFIIAISAQSKNSTYPNCRPVNCGTVNISYPFWKMDTESTAQFCGYDGFGINCSDTGDQFISQITLGGDSYYVREINYAFGTIFLADYDVSPAATDRNNCPRVRHGINLGTLPLNFSMYSVNLSFHFECNGCPSFATEIPCLDNNGGKSCVHNMSTSTEETADWEEYSCDQEVVTTVYREYINMSPNFYSEYSRILEGGFGMQWRTMDIDDCEKCEESGGRCGRQVTTELLCFCSDGTIGRRDCKGTIVTIL
ncbi:hypothetical protein L1987_12684 [Smallanthus sonchifolius]|uniref:Uncharacterized protein n=1 Tax=Smallanthus sonchifolius TaxID=185202 RepID=A0ACB9JG03_9ASTR|nr:hypothetical protein L1987_12684 [Smallanthus sonchifolius]